MATPTRKKPQRTASVAEPKPQFEHRPVDEAGGQGPAGSATTLSDMERQLLGAAGLSAIVDRIASRETDPYTAAQTLLTSALAASSGKKQG